MKKNEMIIPENCLVLEENEMMYLNGGIKIQYHWTLYTTVGANMRAASEISKRGWKNISLYDLSAEIWFHAYAYYNGSALNRICKALGFNGITKTGFWESLSNGIDVKNGLDTEKECGVKRYVIFRAAYAYAIANPGMI